MAVISVTLKGIKKNPIKWFSLYSYLLYQSGPLQKPGGPWRMLYYHKLNQVVAPILASVPDVMSLLD